MKRSFRVVLISPYSHISAIGPRQISACLKTAGWDTRMIFLPDIEELLCVPWPHQHDYPLAVLDQVCDLCADVDLVGISVMSNFVGRARALTKAIHERLSIPVIWGGIHPTVRPNESLNWADFVCVGEGEEAIVELVGRLEAHQDCTNIPNIWAKEDTGRVIANQVRPLNQSLDQLPLPDYDLREQYILHQDQMVPLSSALLAHYMLDHFGDKPRPVYMVFMTRGCPYRCTYCSTNAFMQIYPDWRKVRRRSPEHVIAEIKAAQQLIPNLHAIRFADDTFLSVSIDEIRRFSKLYGKQVGLPFGILVSPATVTDEKLRYLAAAGLRFVEMGIQTGSRRTQKLYQRSANNKQILKAAQCLYTFREQIPNIRYDVISDNPYETDADHLETLQLLWQLPRPFRLYLFSLTPYPGTVLYGQAKADGLIQDDEKDVYQKNYNLVDPTYYNFVLWCLHRNLPRWLLWLLIQPLLLRVFGSGAMECLTRVFWKVLNSVHTRHRQRVYLQQVSRLALDGESR